MGFLRFSLQTAIISLNRLNQLIVVMVQCGDAFEVRPQFLDYLDKLEGFKTGRGR